MASTTHASRLNEKSALRCAGGAAAGIQPLTGGGFGSGSRVQELVDQRTGEARGPGQVTYQAIAIDEPAGKPLAQYRKVSVHLTLMGEEDARVWAEEGSKALGRLRVCRLVHEALLQGGALRQEDLACSFGFSLRTVKRIFAHCRSRGQRVSSRGEIRDIGPGVSHKIPVIRKYVQDLSFSRISRAGRSMACYLRHLAVLMILQDRA